MSYEGKSREDEGEDNTDELEPGLIWIVYMLCIFSEWEYEPRHHDHEYSVEMECECWEDIERDKWKRESTYRKKECSIIEEEKKC